jgi:hypothetical protein
MKARPEDHLQTIVQHDAVDTFARAVREAAGRPISDIVWLADHGNHQAMRVMNAVFRDTIRTVLHERWPGARLAGLSPQALTELHLEVRQRLSTTSMQHQWRWN